METKNALKEVGKKIISSKIFWYVVLGVVALLGLRKLFPSIFTTPPKVVVLPDEDKSPSLTSQWWSAIGKNIMIELHASMQVPWYIPSGSRRATIFAKVVSLDKAQATYLYNEFNKAYSIIYYKGRTMTAEIDSQFVLFGGKEELVSKLISYNLP